MSTPLTKWLNAHDACCADRFTNMTGAEAFAKATDADLRWLFWKLADLAESDTTDEAIRKAVDVYRRDGCNATCRYCPVDAAGEIGLGDAMQKWLEDTEMFLVYHAILREGTITFLTEQDRDVFIGSTPPEECVLSASWAAPADIDKMKAWREGRQPAAEPAPADQTEDVNHVPVN